MNSAKYVIVGGGVAGTTAAATIRQHDDDGAIALISNEPHPLYSRPSLSGFMRGEHSLESVFLRDESYYKNKNIQFLHASASHLNVDDRFVELADGTHINYEKLLIASGARTRHWSVAGADLDGVMGLRTIEDANDISDRIKKAKHVVVVGGGFITLELAHVLAKVGVQTSILLRGDYYWQNVLDEESGKLLDTLLHKSPNVTVHYRTTIEQVLGEKTVAGVVLSNGRSISTSLVLTNTGIDFNTEWLKDSGVTIERGVVVNQYLQTDFPDIYAAGDIALFYDPLIELYHQQGNWNNASLQGQIAGQNMVGHQSEFAGVTSYSISFLGSNISFLGQTSTRPSIMAVPRGSARSGAYGRILIKNDKIIGATLINRFAERQPLSRLISSQVSVKNNIIDLTDESYSLATLADRLGA